MKFFDIRSKRHRTAFALLLVALMGAPPDSWAAEEGDRSAQADERAASARETDGQVSARQDATEPAVVHHPHAVLTGEQKVRISATVIADWKLDEIWVAARPIGSEQEYASFPLERVGDVEFAAIIPRDVVRPPGIEYYIASRDPQGQVQHHFTSGDRPHRLIVHPTEAQLAQKRHLSRFDGHRSRFELRGEYTAYGRRSLRESERPVWAPEEPRDMVTDTMSDTYWVTELEYTFRLLTWIHDIRFGVGRLRGSRPTVTIGDGQYTAQSDSEEDEPGYDYGFGETNLSFHENFSVGLRLVLGASHDGFAAGAGGVVRIGQIGGTHFELGGETQGEIGNRLFMSFAWDTVPQAPMALTIELSDRPDEDGPSGSRLLYDVGYEASEAITLDARLGYASRDFGIEGGFVAGLGASYEF